MVKRGVVRGNLRTTSQKSAEKKRSSQQDVIDLVAE
jgi:hypothetical protein